MEDRAGNLAQQRWRRVGTEDGDPADIRRYAELSEPGSFRDDVKLWVDGALSKTAGELRNASHEQILTAWQRLPRSQRSLPPFQLARAVADVLATSTGTGPGVRAGLRGGGGGFEAEFTEILELAPEWEDAWDYLGMELASRDDMKVVLEVENEVLFRGADGRFYRDESAARRTGRATPAHPFIPEIVSEVQKVLPHETARKDKRGAFFALRAVEQRLEQFHSGSQAFEEVFRLEDGWKHSELARGAVIRPRAVGDGEGMNVHYSFGVPLAGLHEFLGHVRDNTWRTVSQGFLTRLHLSDALEFGNELAVRYALWRAHREVRLNDVVAAGNWIAEIIPADPAVAALRGHAALLYESTVGIVQKHSYSGLSKVNIAVLSRNDHADIREALSADVQAYLADDQEAILQTVEVLIERRLPNYWEDVRRLNPDYPVLDSFMDIAPPKLVSVREFVRAGLVPVSAKPLQSKYFGCTSLPELDRGEGEEEGLPLVVGEVRAYGARHVSVAEAERNYDRLARLAGDAYASARAATDEQALADAWNTTDELIRLATQPATGRATAALQRALTAQGVADRYLIARDRPRVLSSETLALLIGQVPVLDGPDAASADVVGIRKALQEAYSAVLWAKTDGVIPGERADDALNALDGVLQQAVQAAAAAAAPRPPRGRLQGPRPLVVPPAPVQRPGRPRGPRPGG